METAQQAQPRFSTRFDYIAYDEIAQDKQRELKDTAKILEEEIEVMLPAGRAKSLALTALEECYMWIGKGIRDDQISRNGAAQLQEQRTNS